MFEGVIHGVFAALILLGVVSISYYIMLKILHPKSAGKYIIVIPVTDKASDVASHMYAEKLRIELLGDKGSVIALDYGMDEHERALCSDMCKNSEGLYMCTPDMLNELLSGEDL